MTATEPLFLDTVSPEVRKTLVAERLCAMRGRLGEAELRLRALIGKAPPHEPADMVALGSLLSELLHLDGRDDQAIAVFMEVIEPRQPSLPVAAQLVVTDNLATLQMASLSGEGASIFYHLVDRRRVVQFETSDADALLEAQGAIEQERYTEALPPLWQNLLRAYSLGSWRASRRAAERLGRLYLKIGAMEQACHYLILAEAEKQVDYLAAAVARRRDPELVRAILSRLTTYANLRRHFIMACKFLEKVPDLIPDDSVQPLAEWLLPRCQELPVLNGGGVMRAAWEALRELGPRLPQATSRKMIEAALSHPIWQAPPPGGNRVIPEREVMAEAVTFLAHSAPAEYLPEVVEATLPLATDRVQDHDYGSVVNLLCNLSQLGGPVLQERIKTELYVPGKAVNRVLAQVAGFFGAEALTPERWEAFATRVIDETRLTVQRLKPGEAPKPVPETLMTMTQSSPSGQLQVTVQGGVGLEALARAKRYLTEATIGRLIRALVEMATNPDNLLSNRELLLSQLCEFADRADSALREEVIRAIEPLARGEVPESSEYPTSSAGRQPLAAARMNLGTPQEVQALALVAAATFCGSDAARSRQISDALTEGFVNPHITVRRGAYAAARRLPDLSGEQLLPLLMGLRDADPSASVAAFAAFAERKEWSLTRPMSKLFLLAARLASQSPDANLRRHAAIAVRARLELAPTVAIRSESEAILQALASDVAYSVRDAAVVGKSG